MNKMVKFVLFIAILLAFALAVWKWSSKKKTTVEVEIYCINASGDALISQKIKLPNPDVAPINAAQELVKRLVSPPCKSSIKVLPNGVKVTSINLTGDTIIVNFNQKFLTPENWSGSDIAYLRLQALIHSFASVYGVKRVKILVDGKTPPSLGGHEELKDAIEPDPSVLAH